VVDALRVALGRTYVVDDWDEAVLLHGRLPSLTFVTPTATSPGPDGYRGGGVPRASAVLTATAADEAEARAAELTAELERARRRELERARAELAAAREVLDAATEPHQRVRRRITGAAERLARLNKELGTRSRPSARSSRPARELLEVLERDRAALSELNARGPDDAPEEDVDDGPDHEAERLDAAVEAARDASSTRGSARAHHRAGPPPRAAGRPTCARGRRGRAALAEAARRREARRPASPAAASWPRSASSRSTALDASIAEAGRGARPAPGARSARRASSSTRSASARRPTAELDEVREERHAAELRVPSSSTARAARRPAPRRAVGLSPEELAAEHPDAATYDRPSSPRREDVLVRKLGLLGRVNPLALEEFKALEERHAFLSDQLDDLRRPSATSRRSSSPSTTGSARSSARPSRTSRASSSASSRSCSPAAGRLVLTDPDDLLTTGIEVEARPPGKKVKRLSLLSGGERSLTVLAFVFAIFRARPSPFYVLDEVDAALDDVNLQRLLKVIESFRGHSQIIMVTHQKRSMEIADVLYGITMGPDAVTKVVAERLGDERLELDPNLPEPAGDPDVAVRGARPTARRPVRVHPPPADHVRPPVPWWADPTAHHHPECRPMGIETILLVVIVGVLVVALVAGLVVGSRRGGRGRGPRPPRPPVSATRRPARPRRPGRARRRGRRDETIVVPEPAAEAPEAPAPPEPEVTELPLAERFRAG
jgi:chromosome segregation protein